MKAFSLLLIFVSCLALVGLGSIALLQEDALNLPYLAVAFVGLFAGLLMHLRQNATSRNSE